MAYEQRENTGSLFRNNEKKSERHPDYSGNALIGGVNYFMDAWIKEGKNGIKFMSFSFKPKQQQGGGGGGKKDAEQRVADADLPF